MNADLMSTIEGIQHQTTVNAILDIMNRAISNYGFERFIVSGTDEPDDVRHFRMRYRLGLEPAGEAENLEEAKRLIGIGVGIGFLPTSVAETARRDTLWPLLPAPMLPSYLLYLVTRPEADQTLPTQLFLAEIRRRLAALGGPL